MSKLTKIIYSIATIAGTAIGVGIFSLPYLAAKTSFWLIVGYFCVLGLLVTIVQLFFGELALATPDFKRLPGFAQFYLGKWGKRVATFTSILGTFGAILAYLIVGGEFMGTLLSPYLGIQNPLFYTVAYFLIGALLILFGIKVIAQIEFLGVVSFFWVLLVIFTKSGPLINPEYFLSSFNDIHLSNFFLPYGAVLFSLWGAALIPEVEEMLNEDKKLLKFIIPAATIVPVVIYLFFIYLILGITGPATTESALTGLKEFLSTDLVVLTLALGVITTFTSFISLGLTLKRIFRYDLGMGNIAAWALTCFPPLIIFLLGLKSFITVISLGGGIMLGLDGILILVMYNKYLKDKGKNYAWLITTPFALIFVVGLVLEIIQFLK